jgi:chemotaxis protein methyltransferase CheR
VLPGTTAAKASPETQPSDPYVDSPHFNVSPQLFQKFQKLIYGETGIWLGTAKTALLCGRLYRRVRTLGLDSLASYYECVSQPEQDEERARMIDAITTNETRFFREPRQFEFLMEQVFPRWQAGAERELRPRRLRIWSAGCSSGEEPYTLAMLLAKHFPEERGWDVRILATDISHRVLDKARRGIYPMSRSAEIPKDLLHTFMLRGTNEQEGNIKVRVEVQQMVDFRRVNVNQESVPDGPFDAVFCRNVLIYFDAASKERAVRNLLHHLMPNGLLFVGHAENLTSVSPQLRSLEPTIYTKTGHGEER